MFNAYVKYVAVFVVILYFILVPRTQVGVKLV